MKIRLKTEFWQSEKHEEWKERYKTINDGHLMVYITILAGIIFESQLLTTLPAATMAIICITLIISHNQHNKKERKLQEIRCKQLQTHNIEGDECKWCGKTITEIITQDTIRTYKQKTAPTKKPITIHGDKDGENCDTETRKNK